MSQGSFPHNSDILLTTVNGTYTCPLCMYMQLHLDITSYNGLVQMLKWWVATYHLQLASEAMPLLPYTWQPRSGQSCERHPVTNYGSSYKGERYRTGRRITTFL